MKNKKPSNFFDASMDIERRENKKTGICQHRNKCAIPGFLGCAICGYWEPWDPKNGYDFVKDQDVETKTP